MTQPMYEYQPKDVDELIVRDFNFDFPEDIDPVWAPGNPVRSHLFNGFSLTMPYLEPYLIRSALRAREHITDPELLEDLAGFNPRKEPDPQWMKDWIKGHATLPKGALIPLVDTSNPEMPVPF